MRGSLPAKSTFLPKNPEKYVGSKGRKPGGEFGLIVARSNWERQVMKFLDENPNVLLWNSEGIAIPYVHPLDKRIHRYYPDFLIRAKQHDGSEQTLIVEIKPAKEAKRKPKKARDRVILAINESKWTAARAFCAARGWRFVILTEDEISFVK